MSPGEGAEGRSEQQLGDLRGSLRRVVLLRETGPKSAAWHRARVRTIWRLHQLIAGEHPPPPQDDPSASDPSTPLPSHPRPQ